MNSLRRTLLVGSIIALTLSGPAAAQVKPADAQTAEAKPCDAASYPTPQRRQECYQANRVIKTYYLAHTLQQNEANEILIALRNTLDQGSKMYLIASHDAILLAAPPDQQELAQKVIAELDLPRKTFRLNFTLDEFDGGKRTGVQHFSVYAVDGQRTVVKQGSKVPVITSTYDPNGQNAENIFQYLDIGITLDLTLTYTPGGLYLKSKVEQSSVAEEHMTGPLAPEPVVHQTSLDGMSALTAGKPLTLGSLDVTGTNRHIDIQVVAEPTS